MLEFLAIQNNETLNVMGGIVFNFEDANTLPNHVNYTIRLRAEQVDRFKIALLHNTFSNQV